MPVVYQKFIHRDDLHRNRGVLYLFGDNVQRRGMGGQAAEMRGEPNAIGVRTKRAPFIGPGAFFTDEEFDKTKEMIWNDLEPAFAHVKKGGIVVIPSEGLGTDRAQLQDRAPITFAFLVSLLASLEKSTP